MILILDNIEDLVEGMEKISPGDWTFARPSINHLQETLANFLETPAAVRSFDSIGGLSIRILTLCGKTREGLMTGPRHVAGDEPADEVLINSTTVCSS